MDVQDKLSADTLSIAPQFTMTPVRKYSSIYEAKMPLYSFLSSKCPPTTRLTLGDLCKVTSSRQAHTGRSHGIIESETGSHFVTVQIRSFSNKQNNTHLLMSLLLQSPPRARATSNIPSSSMVQDKMKQIDLHGRTSSSTPASAARPQRSPQLDHNVLGVDIMPLHADVFDVNETSCRKSTIHPALPCLPRTPTNSYHTA